MADYNSSLPVRSEGEENHVLVKLADAVLENQLAEIDSDRNLHVELHGNKADNSDVVLKLNDAGKIITDGVYNASTNLDPSSIGVIASTRAGDQDKKVTAVAGASDVIALDVALHDEAGNAFSSSNPLPVEFFENLTEIYNYNAADSVAKDASATHTYSAVAGFKLHEVYASGSGKIKAELKIGLSTVAVGFNSTANPMVTWTFAKGLNASSVDVSIVVTNLDNLPQNIYTTIVGAA